MNRMNSKLVPNVAKHFLSSVLQYDSDSAERISDVISQQNPEQIIKFLMTLGGILDTYFTILENEIPEYEERKLWICNVLKSYDNDEEVEESTSGGHFSEYSGLKEDWDESRT